MTMVRSAAAACLLAACFACGGSDDVPPLEKQIVTPPQAAATPERVQGCLRAGEGSDTFVLTASVLDTQMGGAATYELVGAHDALRPHVGKRVEITGTIVSEQTAQARGVPMAAEDKAKGTTGTPTVQSTTEVEVKRLEVSGVTPVAGECQGQ